MFEGVGRMGMLWLGLRAKWLLDTWRPTPILQVIDSDLRRNQNREALRAIQKRGIKYAARCGPPFLPSPPCPAPFPQVGLSSGG